MYTSYLTRILLLPDPHLRPPRHLLTPEPHLPPQRRHASPQYPPLQLTPAPLLAHHRSPAFQIPRTHRPHRRQTRAHALRRGRGAGRGVGLGWVHARAAGDDAAPLATGLVPLAVRLVLAVHVGERVGGGAGRGRARECIETDT